MSSTFASVRLQRAPPLCKWADSGRSRSQVQCQKALHQAWLDNAYGVIAELQEGTGMDLFHVRAGLLDIIIRFRRGFLVKLKKRERT
eukprot:6213068-Pleurochrysis_carterae.AAC.3